MRPPLTDTLCTRCGLCCDGSLFADVELKGPREAAGLELMGLEIEEDDSDGNVMALPCVALHGTRCSVYAHRPECCRTFECRLLKNAQRGAVSVEHAIGIIAEARLRVGEALALLEPLERHVARLPLKERCAEVLATDVGGDAVAVRARAELEAAMNAVERVIAKNFL